MSSQSSGDHHSDDLDNTTVGALPSQPRHTPLSSLSQVAAHGAKSYQAISKSLTRPVVTGGPSVLSPAHVSASQLPTILPTGIQIGVSMDTTTAMSTTSAAVVSASPSAAISVGMSTPSIVQISATSSSSLLTQALPLAGSMRGLSQHQPNIPTHLPRGPAAAASVVACPKSVMTAMPVLRHSAGTIQMPAAALHTSGHTSLSGPRSQLISPNIRSSTPPQKRAPSPAVSLAVGSAAPAETHRMGISLQTTGSTSTTPSIQITLQAPRTTTEPLTKQILSQPAKQIHVSQTLTPQNLTATPKVLMSQAAITPIIQHPSLKAAAQPPKQNKAAVPAVVAPALSSTGMPSLSISSVTPVSATPSIPSIPIAKVPPVRQPTSAGPLSGITRLPVPQDLGNPRDAPSQSHTPQSHPAPHSQSGGGIFVPQAQTHRPPSLSSSSHTNPSPVAHSDVRPERMPNMSQYPLPMTHLLEYQQLMYHQLASQHASQIRGSTGLFPTGGSGPHNLAVSSAQTVKFSPMAVVGDQLRLQTMSVHTPFSSAPVSTAAISISRSSTPNDSSIVSNTPSTASIPVPALSAIAMASTNVAVTMTQNLYPMSSGAPHPGSLTPQHSSTQSSQGSTTPVSQPNASPRPSILRKRTNEGNAPVKKPVCGLNTMSDRHSPRPDSRTDSAPQSNTSSPKTPAGESQSSTDTALSSEATTPTHNSVGDLKIKQEPADAIENGFPTAGSLVASLSNSLPNSVEASPRKKPRKQLLHANEELRDNSSTDEDIEKIEEIKEEVPNEVKKEMKDEYVDDEGVRWTIEKTKPTISLLNFYNISWKPKNNHFNRYTDVKPKDERRPTVNELSNQRGVMQKASGWKLYHVAAQLEDLTELERTLNNKVLTLQLSMAPQPPSRHSVMEDDLGLLHELTQGNIQRSKLISDQLEEAKSNMFKVLEHKQKIFEIINKHMSKRPIKKKERT